MTERHDHGDRDDEIDVEHTYTIPSDPPEPKRPQRRSWWPPLFEECRRHPREWRRCRTLYSKSTAGQLASDIVNIPRRNPKRPRVAGLLPGERWETHWAAVDEVDGASRYGVWLRYLGGPEPEGDA